MTLKKQFFEAFDLFEKEGFTEDDLTRIKARNETSFYTSFSSILSKAFTLAQYQTFKGDPQFFMDDFARTQAVTMDDIKNVYQKYIKGKNYVQTSFVPRGEVNLIAEGAVNAGIVEEDVTKAAEVKAETAAEEPMSKHRQSSTGRFSLRWALILKLQYLRSGKGHSATE